MVTTRGKIHNYLGMTLDYNIDGKVQITMFEYIAKIIEAFPMELSSVRLFRSGGSRLTHTNGVSKIR